MYNFKLCFLLFSILFLTSCSALIRQTGFEPSTTTDFDNRLFSCVGDTCNGIRLNDSVRIYSSCEQAIIALIGPYPIFPNPFYLSKYYNYKHKDSDIIVSFYTEKNNINFDDLKITISFNGNNFKPTKVNTITNKTYDHVEYVFTTRVKCKEMEDSLILVSINGLPENIEDQIMFKHKWQLFFEL